MRRLLSFLSSFFVISCSSLLQDNTKIKNLAIAIPSNVNSLDYWPNSKNIIEFYGEPSSKRITKYGEVLTFDNVPGCDLLQVYFETDAEREHEKLVSSMIFVSVSIKNGSIELGANSKSSNVLLNPLVIDGITYANRFYGMGSSVQLIKQNDGGNSIIVSWE